jgi:Zn-dependent protease/predicted transcriptional regulator
MSASVKLGKLFGIEVGFNWSLLFIFALIAWTLATDIFPASAPGFGDSAYWLTAVIGALIFLGCILAHELAHAIVASRNGVKVAGITLWLFGGVSQLSGEPKSARTEALITAVGPLSSLLIGAIAFLIAFITPGDGIWALTSALLSWLAFLNLGLAIFNLVPAFPLDGGRLLSSLFWWRSGSRRRGVHMAVTVGRVVAFLMIAYGVLQFFQRNVVGGIWIGFIGWFLLSAASAEESSTVTKALLRSVKVASAMTSPVTTVPDWLTLDQFLSAVAAQHRFTTYPVHDPSGALTGVVNLRDAVEAASAGGHDRRLKDVARPISDFPTARPDEELDEVLDRVGPAFDRRVLVFNDGQVVGIISPADVARLVALRRAMERRSSSI